MDRCIFQEVIMVRESLNNLNISVRKMEFLSACFRNPEQESPMGKIIEDSVTNIQN